MTEQEAIDVFKGFKFLPREQRGVDIAIKALEKQIPRELTHIRKVKKYDGYDMGNCPVCGEPLDNSFYENLKYCFVCGQAIKWE